MSLFYIPLQWRGDAPCTLSAYYFWPIIWEIDINALFFQMDLDLFLFCGPCELFKILMIPNDHSSYHFFVCVSEGRPNDCSHMPALTHYEWGFLFRGVIKTIWALSTSRNNTAFLDCEMMH